MLFNAYCKTRDPYPGHGFVYDWETDHAALIACQDDRITCKEHALSKCRELLLHLACDGSSDLDLWARAAGQFVALRAAPASRRHEIERMMRSGPYYDACILASPAEPALCNMMERWLPGSGNDIS